MKKLLTLVLLASLLLAGGVSAQVVELPDLGGETITVAVENAYPPFNYLDDSGEAIGWDYDVINSINYGQHLSSVLGIVAESTNL